MKFSFDAHVPIAIFEFFQLLENRGRITKHSFRFANDYVLDHDPKDDDRPWMYRFAEDGGEAIITGDKKIRGRLHEQAAYIEAGLILYMLPPKWNDWKLFRKMAFLLNWWERISEHCTTASPSTCWAMPLAWEGGKFKDATGPLRAPQPTAAAVVRLKQRR